VVTITVTRTGYIAGTSTVRYSGTNGSATYPNDYGGPAGSLSFAPGETAKRFTVTIKNDTTAEGNETFTLFLAEPTSATLGNPKTTVVTIVDDDKSSATLAPQRATINAKSVRQ